ncbi:MAG: DHH family phosphoesterase [Clostridia bacterium]|nr:DHH family phosphoesterase [Clostridia bacterium]
MKRFIRNNAALLGIFAVTLLTTAVTLLYNRPVGVIGLVLWAALVLFSIVSNVWSTNKTKNTLADLDRQLDVDNLQNLSNFPMPLIVCTETGAICWYNSLFKNGVLGDFRPNSDEIFPFLDGQTMDDLAAHSQLFTCVSGRYYSVYSFPFETGGKAGYALLFSDETDLQRTAYEYKASRPRVMLISIDNLDDILSAFTDSDSDSMRSQVERLIDKWLSDYGCLVRRLGDGRFVVVCEERDLALMIERRFDILDTVRAYQYDGKVVGFTLSIGVSGGETLRKCETNARQALDMAIGRGGDQAAIFKTDTYQFFGGVSKGVEKRSKARTRIISSSIAKLMENSSHVFIMGHRFSDLDSIGSGVGMYCAAAALGKETKIVVRRRQTLAKGLVDMIEERLGDVFCEPEEALPLIDRNTLLIISDTHREDVLESAEIYRAAQTIVIIDHHRKNVDFINNAIVFQHDPTASSACEMVSELLQYMPSKPPISECVADALLAGIMLDTKNFALKTGVRTFEAAAFLKSKGADTVRVRRLFMNKLEDLKKRNDMIGSCEKYRDCAIAFADFESPNIRTITSQAADEMLNIDGVKASFTLFRVGDTVNVSARSLGDINVQIIMEALGGGGHLTMAAAQLNGCDFDSAKTQLFAAIDQYYAQTK